jgi:NDP-sugar pyrophosphorylase family protein
MQAIVLAGGKGARLKPFTNAIPKPLVPIGDMPILEVVLRQLKKHGFTHVTLAVNHLARLIEAFFGDGEQLGLHIDYSLEDRAMGTAGPLKLLKNLDDHFLVMNGDLLTTLDYSRLMSFHLENRCDITIGTFAKKLKIDLGVVESEGPRFLNYIEKPTYSFMVSMGVYALNRGVVASIPDGQPFDMPDLVLSQKRMGKTVMCFMADCEWLDIGRVDDYETAVELFESSRERYLPG